MSVSVQSVFCEKENKKTPQMQQYTNFFKLGPSCFSREEMAKEMTELLARWVEILRETPSLSSVKISTQSIASISSKLTRFLMKTRICDAEILLKNPVEFVDC